MNASIDHKLLKWPPEQMISKFAEVLRVSVYRLLFLIKYEFDNAYSIYEMIVYN